MKKFFLALIIVSLLTPPSVYAVSEICPDPDGNGPLAPASTCCTAPTIIQNVGGCPAGTVWIGNAATGQCATPATCNTSHQSFLCETNSCYAQPPGPVCSTAGVTTGSSLPCCTNGQVAIRDSLAPTGWKCADQPDPVKLTALQGFADGVINVLEDLLTELQVSNVKMIVDLLSQILNATTPAQITQYKNDLIQELQASSVNIKTGGGVFVGETKSAYDGKRNGYVDANSICSVDLPGSHICDSSEMINSYNTGSAQINSLTDSVWINNGPPGYIVNVANDCSGWQSSSSTVFGYVWDGQKDASFITPCNMQRAYACCQ